MICATKLYAFIEISIDARMQSIYAYTAKKIFLAAVSFKLPVKMRVLKLNTFQKIVAADAATNLLKRQDIHDS